MVRIFQSLKRVFVPKVGTLVRRSRQMPGGAMIVEYSRPTPTVRVDSAEPAPVDAVLKATVLSSGCRS